MTGVAVIDFDGSGLQGSGVEGALAPRCDVLVELFFGTVGVGRLRRIAGM